MGWLKNLWDNVTDWVHDAIVEPIVDWVEELIHDTTVAIRIWKHEFHKLLNKWLENDFFFLGAIAATIALAVFWPQVTAWVGKMTIVVVLKEAWKDVEEGWVDVLDFIHIVELDTINTILNVFWPDWKAMNAQLIDVTSSLAAELGKGTEYLHAYFSVIHGIAIVENSFVGADPKLAEMQAFEDTSAALQKIDEKFWDYAENPALIVSDMIEDFYLPRAGNIGTAQQDVIDSVRENRDNVVAINTAFHSLEGRLTHFIEVTPEDLKEIMSERLQPIADALADALWVMDTEIMPKVDGVIDALELQTERQQTINDNVLARIGNPYGLLVQGEFLGVEERESLEDYLAELNRRAEERDLAESIGGLDGVADALAGATEEYFFEGLTVEQPHRPALSLEIPGIPSTTAFPSWFRGEG